MTVVVYGQNGSVKFVPATCSLFRLAAISIVGLSTNEAARRRFYRCGSLFAIGKTQGFAEHRIVINNG
jgi:hypothetical protein